MSENYDWKLGFDVLGELLRASDGSVSSTALVRELRRRGAEEPKDLMKALQFFDREAARERGIALPDFDFRHLERSFYLPEKYEQELGKLEEETTRVADVASRDAAEAPDDTPPPRAYRQEEARLAEYVKTALQGLYASDANPDENREYVFNVHSARKGSSFENVDLLAVHWLHKNVCELITVEVKLEFSPQAVHQALNYSRFSHRCWVAAPVESNRQSELRERYPALFEYAITRGLGILACHRRQGGRYDVFPVHWPLRHQPHLLEEEEFLERYKSEFAKAGIRAGESVHFPRLR